MIEMKYLLEPTYQLAAKFKISKHLIRATFTKN